VFPQYPHLLQQVPNLLCPAQVTEIPHLPSLETERVPLVPVPDGAAAEAVLEPAAGKAGEAGELGAAEDAEEAGTVANPELAGAEEGTGAMEMMLDAEGAVEALDAEGAAEALPPELPELDPDPPPMPLTAAQVPVNVPAPWDVPVTSGPGFGNATSLPSTVVQPLARLATNKSGREEKGVVR